MKRLILIIVCFAAFAGGFAQVQSGQQEQQGQQGGGRSPFSPEMFKQRLEQFVTWKACLTPEESQKFFPMLHEMLNKQRENNNKAHELMRQCDENDAEANYEKAIEKAIAYDLENRKIEKEYYKKFHSALSWKKIYKVRMALSEWQMEALRRFSPHAKNQHVPWWGKQRMDKKN